MELEDKYLILPKNILNRIKTQLSIMIYARENISFVAILKYDSNHHATTTFLMKTINCDMENS